MFRVSRATSLALAQHLVLYPASLAPFDAAVLTPQPRLEAPADPRCRTVLVPAPAAVYASMLRMMRAYSRYAPTRIVLESDLSELIGYHLYGLEDGYVDVDDEEACEALGVDSRVEDAVRTVREWREGALLEGGEGWEAGMLEDIVSGKRTVEDVPWAEAPSPVPTVSITSPASPVSSKL